MDKLEAYLDRVCRGIAGPRSLRAHIRQELREHLKDAAAEHAAAGLSDEEALARAIDEFGGPDEVRAQLEATHGQRFLTVVIDKAMLWKEKTMKARWLWSTWAHAALVAVIAMQVFLLWSVVVFILPKFREMVVDDMIHTGPGANAVTAWGVNFVTGLANVMEHFWWLALLVAAAWVVFEWFIRGENKTLMRLTKLGMIAAALCGVVGLTAAALVLPLIVEFPDLRRVPPVRVAELTREEMDAMASGLIAGDPRHLQWQAQKAIGLLTRLRDAAPLLEAKENAGGAVRERYSRSLAALEEMHRAIAAHDLPRAREAQRRFKEAYETTPAPATLAAPDLVAPGHF